MLEPDDDPAPLLAAVAEATGRLGVGVELIVVDAGAGARVRELTAAHGGRLVASRETGYGGAVLAGLAAAPAPRVITLDADLELPATLLDAPWARPDEADILVASRYVAGGSASMRRWRTTASRALNRVYRRALSLPIHDLSSGCRLYHTHVFEGLRIEARDFDFLEEALIRIYSAGWRVRKVTAFSRKSLVDATPRCMATRVRVVPPTTAQSPGRHFRPRGCPAVGHRHLPIVRPGR